MKSEDISIISIHFADRLPSVSPPPTIIYPYQYTSRIMKHQKVGMREIDLYIFNRVSTVCDRERQYKTYSLIRTNMTYFKINSTLVSMINKRRHQERLIRHIP